MFNPLPYLESSFVLLVVFFEGGEGIYLYLNQLGWVLGKI